MWAARARAFFGSVATVSVVAIALAGIAMLITTQPVFAVGIAAAALIAIVTPRFRWAAEPWARGYRWLPAAWLVIFLSSNLKFTPERSPLAAAAGGFSFDNLLEVTSYALVGVVALAALYRFGRSPRPLNLVWLAAWPVVALLSTAWSITRVFSGVRSLQLFVPVALAALSIRVWREDQATGALLWRATLRLFVQAITLLTIIGFALPGRWEQGYPATVRRFKWPWAQHAVLATGMIGFGLVILVIGGRALTGFSLPLFLGRIALLSGALVFGQTRSVILGVGAATLVALWVAGRHRPLARYLGLPILAMTGFFVATLFSQPLDAYVLRGQSAYALSTLSGRLAVWQLAVQAVSSGNRWLFGFGYGAARVILFEQLSWAGEAHNTWLELLLGLGLIGAAAAIVGIVVFGVALFRTQTRYSACLSVSSALFVYLLVLSQADYYLATPGFAFTALAFLYWFVMGERGVDGSRMVAVEPREARLLDTVI
jgi:hypothetical protein